MVHILEIKEYAKENNVPIMLDGGMDFICNYIKENNIKSILEIGSAIGYSAIRFASINNDITVTTIERDVERYNEAVKNIKNESLENRITIYNDDALVFTTNDKFDLIFIDAAKGKNIDFFTKFFPYGEYNHDVLMITYRREFFKTAISPVNLVSPYTDCGTATSDG